ncbi:hypothetical protein [Streptomyces sp. NPDC089799]
MSGRRDGRERVRPGGAVRPGGVRTSAGPTGRPPEVPVGARVKKLGPQ